LHCETMQTLAIARTTLVREADVVAGRHADRTQQPAPEPEWVPLKIAAADLRITEKTMVAYARTYGLGHKPAGVWMIDMARVRAWQAGLTYDRLAGK
jgi:hypothetical protein